MELIKTQTIISDDDKSKLFNASYIFLLNSPGHPSWHRLHPEAIVSDYRRGVFNGEISAYNTVFLYLGLEEEYNKYLKEKKDTDLLGIIVGDRERKHNLELVKDNILSLINKAGISQKEFLDYLKNKEVSK